MSEREPAAPLALAVDGLTKRYGDTLALDGVSLQLAAGTVYGLAGPNGGGKTTLLRILATLERPTAGTIRVYGHDPLIDAPSVRRLVGYAGPGVGTPELTVLEEMEAAARLGGVGRLERLDTIGTMLQIVDLYARRHRRVADLARGDLKRLSIARALVHDPALLLLDAPFEGLDASARTELRAVLAELAALGKTLLIAAGTVSELADLCHEVGLLDRGRLLMSGPAEAVLAAGEPGHPLRLTLADGLEAAQNLLASHPSVHALTPLDDSHLVFRFDGDPASQAALTAALVTAGVAVVELAAAPDEAEAELARLVRSTL